MRKAIIVCAVLLCVSLFATIMSAAVCGGEIIKWGIERGIEHYEEYVQENETNNIDEEDFQNCTINEFVQYLENLIGFVADKYFWSMYGTPPQLPTLISNKANNFARKITIKGYKDMFSSIMTDNSNITAKENILSLYSGIKPLLNLEEKLNYQSKILDSLYDDYGLVENPNIEVLKKCFNTSDILYLKNFLRS